MVPSLLSIRGAVIAGIVLCMGVAVLSAVPTHAASQKDYTRQPGYFDFEPILGDVESNVDILLKGSLLVRAREKGEVTQVYWFPGGKDDIRGLVVMAVGDDDEAAFINIVGSIRPAEIGRIVRVIHIDSMDDPVQVEVESDAQVIVDDDDHDKDGR